MKASDIKYWGLIGLIIIYLIISNIFLIPKFTNIYYVVFQPIFWLSLCTICFFLGGSYIRFKNKIDKIQKIVIILLVYLFVYYFSGLIFGFENSPYSHEILGIIKNIWQFVVFVILQEYVRSYLVGLRNKGKIKLIVVTIVYIIVNINFTVLIQNLSSPEMIFKYASSVIIPLIFSNIALTYLVYSGTFKLSLCYRIPIEVMYILFPLFPSLNWFILGFIKITLPIVILMFISFDNRKRQEGVTRRNLKKENPLLMIPFLAVATISVCFVVGLFKYEPMAIVSNSMSPVYDRGAIIIFEKMNEKQLENLELYTIIVYRLDNIFVSHRIIKKQEISGKVFYITQGDNNNTPDHKKVTVDQIVGVVRLAIPYAGYPSVWLNDILNGQNSVAVETGK